MVEYRNYPRWLYRGKRSSNMRFVGAMVPEVLVEALERVGLLERLTLSDIIRLSLWDFVRERKEAVKGLPIYELLEGKQGVIAE